MKQKSTSLELLRIILALIIPIYHWILYNGILYADNSANSIVALVLFSAIPFTSMYAFIIMSSYFLIKKKTVWSFEKVYSFATLALTLYVFKYIFIHVLYAEIGIYSFIQDFFLYGAWWYVCPYILIMLFYPWLNRFIYESKQAILHMVTAIIGLWFLYNSYTNETVFLNNCVLFLFIYLVMGCLERHEGKSLVYYKHKKKILITIILISSLIITALCIYVKLFAPALSNPMIEGIIQKLHGRYTIFGLISGIALFTLFRQISLPHIPWIHKLSKLTLYVFLLHETVMSVFWRFEIKSIETLAYLPLWQHALLILGYLLCCIVFSYIMYWIYNKSIAPIWTMLYRKLIERKKK